MKYQIPAEAFERHVSKLQQLLEMENDMPPLITNYVDGKFVLNDGNHRFEALKRMGTIAYPFIVWMTEKLDYDDFCKRYK